MPALVSGTAGQSMDSGNQAEVGASYNVSCRVSLCVLFTDLSQMKLLNPESFLAIP